MKFPGQSRRFCLGTKSMIACVEPIEQRLLLSAEPTISLGGDGQVHLYDPWETHPIEFLADDPDSPGATVSLYYDTDMDGDNGKTLIASGLGINDLPQSCDWDLSGVPSGLFYIYGEVDDGETAVGAWFNGAVIRLSYANPIATFDTSIGSFKVFLDQTSAPLTVSNFLNYALSGFYDDLVFHRVISGFMIQGGGFDADLEYKEPGLSIYNENLIGPGDNIPNSTSVIAMARTADPHSATSQFFINVADNSNLDYQNADNPGYATFGWVILGMNVVNAISEVSTQSVGGMDDVPVEPVIINSVTVDFPDLNVGFGDGPVKTVSYTDSDGTAVTVGLTSGRGLLNLKGDIYSSVSGTKEIVYGNVIGSEIILTQSNVTSKLGITTRGGADGRTSISAIRSDTPANILLAAGVDLVGDGVMMTDLGSFNSVHVNSLQNGADIIMEGLSNIPAGIVLQVNTIGAGSSIILASPVRTLTTQQSNGDLVSTPWIGNLISRGDFNSQLVLSGTGAIGLVLKNAKISGNVSASSWQIGGSAGTIRIDGVVTDWTLGGTGDEALASVRSLHLGDVVDADVTVSGAINALYAIRWSAGNIQADSIGAMTIAGNRRTAINGDFGAALTLNGANIGTGLAAKSLTVAGTMNGTMDILAGPVKSIVLGTMEGDVSAAGNVASITVRNSALSLVEPDSGPVYTLTIGAGKTNIRSSSDRMRFANGATLYALQGQPYKASHLLPFNYLSAWWGYSAQITGSSGTTSGTIGTIVADENATVEGRQTYPLAYELDGSEYQKQYWNYAADGVSLMKWTTDGLMGKIDFVYTTGLKVPDAMILKQRYTSTSAVSGVWEIDIDGGVASGGVTAGQAAMTSRWLGHEEITVPYGTLLAAKTEVRILTTGTMVVVYDGGVYTGTFRFTQVQTYWSAAGIGIIQSTEALTQSVSVAGLGSGSYRSVTSMKLEDGSF